MATGHFSRDRRYSYPAPLAKGARAALAPGISTRMACWILSSSWMLLATECICNCRLRQPLVADDSQPHSQRWREKVARAWFLLLSAVGLFGSLALLPPNLSAQGCSPKQGEPVIYGSSQCSGASFGSTAYIDASIFYHSGNYGDLCGTLNSILLGKTTPAYPTAGA